MGKLNVFSIQFNSPQIVYYPGQALSGYVTVSLNQPMEMRGIKFEVKGKGYCHWTETRQVRVEEHHNSEEGNNESEFRTETIHHEGKETIVSWKQVLVGDTHNKFYMPAGNHSFPFTFTLPSSLPSSFEHGNSYTYRNRRHSNDFGSIEPYGYIRYYVKAKIDKPWKFDHKTKRPFTVNDIIDTNLPMHLQPVGGHAHKEPGCCCLKSGAVDLSASIDRKCYCPGEAILVSADVTNQSSRDMTNLHAKIIQTIEFHARTEIKYVERERGRLVGPPVPKGEEAHWQHQPFGIPAVPPSIMNSSVIRVHYRVKIVAAIPCALDGVVKMDILMGTVPFRQTYGQPVQYQTQYDPTAAPPAANFIGDMGYPPPQVAAFGYPDMPPPSYSAALGDQAVAINGKKDEHTHGDLNYAPVYTFAQPYQGTYQGAPPPILQPQDQQQQQPQPYPPPDPNAQQPYPPVNPYPSQPQASAPPPVG